MVSKNIFCPYCGRPLTSMEFKQSKDMHIQRAEVIVVCDQCQKAQTVAYSVAELSEPKICEECGGKRKVAIDPNAEHVSYVPCPKCG